MIVGGGCHRTCSVWLAVCFEYTPGFGSGQRGVLGV
jgi:hypothetical protein